MTTTEKATTTVAPPSLPAARSALTEQLHVLVDAQTREYIMGRAATAAEAAGYKFIRQGETIRELLLLAITQAAEADPVAYERLVDYERAVKWFERAAAAQRLGRRALVTRVLREPLGVVGARVHALHHARKRERRDRHRLHRVVRELVPVDPRA